MLLSSVSSVLATLGLTLGQDSAGVQSNQSTHVLPSDTAIQQALNISTGNPSKCANGTKYFLQPIDHATYNGTVGSTSTFHQQFEVIDTYFKPGGPIIFYQGTENANIVCLEELAGPVWAQELGALLVSLEHRYFGISCPYGLNYTEKASWPVESLKPLTLDNVQLDAVTFVDWVKSHYAGAHNSKVIFVSGKLRLEKHFSKVLTLHRLIRGDPSCNRPCSASRHVLWLHRIVSIDHRAGLASGYAELVRMGGLGESGV
jgi:Serine carboxypeptidase S28